MRLSDPVLFHMIKSTEREEKNNWEETIFEIKAGNFSKIGEIS